MTRPAENIHFVGIGGVGMSGLAELLHARGHVITGSDLKENPTTRRLAELGLGIHLGHQKDHLGEAQRVVASTAIAEDNPELVEARRRGVPIIRRGEMLAEIMRPKQGIAVAGSHGKTTTTSLIGLVAEADESDGSFLLLEPTIAVITNIDPEHLDHYGDFERLESAFVDFANAVPPEGLAVVCADHPGVQAILPKLQARRISYGFSSTADLVATRMSREGEGIRFGVEAGGHRLGNVALPLPGDHNILNALAAIAVGLELDVSFADIALGLARFGGVERRYQVLGRRGGIEVVDDYAHHPAELRATLEAARSVHPGRIVSVFQPHRYTRTRDCMEEFATAFGASDVVIISEIYPAGDSPIPGITGGVLASKIADQGHPDVRFIADLETIGEELAQSLDSGDLVLTLGAGDVSKLGRQILERLPAPPQDQGRAEA